MTTDVFFHILEHVCDNRTLYAVISAIDPSHPLFSSIVQRVWEQPLLISILNWDDSSALIDLLENYQLWPHIRRLVVLLGPSRNYSAFSVENMELERLIKVAQVAASRISPLLHKAKQLRKISWLKAPAPGQVALESLAHLEQLQSFTVDCATGDWRGRNMDEADEYWDIEPFLKTLGPHLSHIVFRNVSEGVFSSMVTHSGFLSALRNLEIDLTCGNWDWNGMGSPQEGPSDQFVFPRLECASHILSIRIIASDLTMRSTKGPLTMIEPRILNSLTIHIQPCFSWTIIRQMRFFEKLSPEDFPALLHLEVRDFVRDGRYQYWDLENVDDSIYQEDGRFYAGLLSFVSGLRRLRSLWTNANVLLREIAPAHGSEDSSWPATEGPYISPEAAMRDPQWISAVSVLMELTSLRVGLGAVDSQTLCALLGYCNRAKLQQLGLQWDWRSYGRDESVSSELLEQLAHMPALRDIHILNPHPDAAKHSEPLNPRLLKDVRAIFAGCPQVSRVGIGKSTAWERAPGILTPDDSPPISFIGGEDELCPWLPPFYHDGFEFEYAKFNQEGIVDYHSVSQQIPLFHALQKIALHN